MNPERRITLVSLVPTMLARLLDAGLERPPTLRWALLGGGPIAPALLERARAARVPVAPTYGMTEACSQIATFGWPLPGVEIRLQGPEREIIVRGPIVAPAARDAEGWLHTGDLGAFDERGRLEIIGPHGRHDRHRRRERGAGGGRRDAARAPGGRRRGGLRPRGPGVGRGDRRGRRAARRSDGRPGRAARVLRCALARFKVPKTIEFVDELPRTESGKLLRRQLTRLV